MKSSLIVFVILATIFLMILIYNWQSNNWKTSVPEEIPIIGNESNNLNYYEGPGFTLNYPYSWTGLKSDFKQLVPDDWEKEYDLKIIFLAQDLTTFAQLIVYEGEFDIPLSTIIKKMAETNQKYDWEVEVVNSDIEENEGIFELRYLIKDSQNLYSKEKAIKIGGKTYIMSVIMLEKDLTILSPQIDQIFSSIDKNE